MSILMPLFSTMSTFHDHLDAKYKFCVKMQTHTLQQFIFLKKLSIKNLLFQEIL